LGKECNCCFLLGCDVALDQSGQDDASNCMIKAELCCRTQLSYTVTPTETKEELSNHGGDDFQNFEEGRVEDVNEQEEDDNDVVNVTD
jgi:hypothetical protein